MEVLKVKEEKPTLRKVESVDIRFTFEEFVYLYFLLGCVGGSSFKDLQGNFKNPRGLYESIRYGMKTSLLDTDYKTIYKELGNLIKGTSQYIYFNNYK